jgi:hypothetical protein
MKRRKGKGEKIPTRKIKGFYVYPEGDNGQGGLW